MALTELTRVTACLDYFKTEWYTDWILKVGRREANAVGAKALKIGKRIDEIIRSGVYEAQKKDTQEVKMCLKNFLAWKERYMVGVIQPLSRINDETIGLTGEGDFYLPESDTLVDYKSSKRISPDYLFQLGGYKRLGFPGRRVAILRCDKDLEEFEFVTNEDLGLSLEQLVDAFESAYKHYRYYKFLEGKLDVSYK